MHVRPPLLVLLVFLVSGLSFGAEGIFQGTVVAPPPSQSTSPGWIFVEGGNHLLRRVEVAHATIVFAPGVSPSQKRKCGPDCLSAGQQVRVTAEQDGSGEWRARRVEILRDAVKPLSGLAVEGNGPLVPSGRVSEPGAYSSENISPWALLPSRGSCLAKLNSGLLLGVAG